MVIYNYKFGNGEIGLGEEADRGDDSNLSCFVIENLIADQKFNWRGRGGSEYIRFHPDIIETVSYKNYFCIRTGSELIFYEDQKEWFRLQYVLPEINPLGFNLSCMIANIGVVVNVTNGFDVGIGFYQKDNGGDNDWKNIDGRIFSNGSELVNLSTPYKYFLGLTINKTTKVVTGSVLLHSGSGIPNAAEILDIKSFLNQIIVLYREVTTKTQGMVFSSGAAADFFRYNLVKAASYTNIEVYSSGLIIYGNKKADLFTTAQNSGSSIFVAANIKGYEYYNGGIELLKSYQDTVMFKPTGDNKLFLKTTRIGEDWKEISCPHTSVSTIKSINVFDGSPIKYVVLFEDGAIDMFYIYKLDNYQLKDIRSRISFYGVVERVVAVDRLNMYFVVNAELQYLKINSKRYLDNWKPNTPTPPEPEPNIYYIKNPPGFVMNNAGGGVFATYTIPSIPPQFNTINFTYDNIRAYRTSATVDLLQAGFRLANLSPTNWTKFNIVLSGIKYYPYNNQVQVLFAINNAWVPIALKVLEGTPTNYNFTMNVSVEVRRNEWRPADTRSLPENRDIESDATFKRATIDDALLVDTEQMEDFYQGKLIQYKFVVSDTTTQGNVLYGRNKEAFTFNMIRLGNNLKPVEISALSEYVTAKIGYEDFIPADLGTAENLEISRPRMFQQYSNINVGRYYGVYSENTTKLNYQGFGSNEPFTVFSASCYLDSSDKRFSSGNN